MAEKSFITVTDLTASRPTSKSSAYEEIVMQPRQLAIHLYSRPHSDLLPPYLCHVTWYSAVQHMHLLAAFQVVIQVQLS